MKGFSIIVCCYNSENMLPRTLAHLAALSLPEKLGTELIIVDNCCTDHTTEVAEKIWSGHGSPIEMKVVREETPGLSAARGKGIRTARYDYLLFCDDDNWLTPDYLQVAHRLFSRHDNIGMLGGLSIPAYECVPDYWPRDFYIYGSGPQAKENGQTRTLHGAAVLMRKAAFNRLQEAGFSFLLTDRKGDSLSSGGDYELCYAVALAGYEIWYHEDLRLSHHIPQDRMTWKYCRRFIHESAPAVNILDVYHFVLTHGEKSKILFYLKQIKYILYHIKMAFGAAIIRHKYAHDKKIYFLETFHREYHITRLISICKNILSYRQYLKKVIRLRSRLSGTPVSHEPAFTKLK